LAWDAKAKSNKTKPGLKQGLGVLEALILSFPQTPKRPKQN
jgi:hypothetical protein